MSETTLPTQATEPVLTVNVAGHIKTGKTTVAAIIANALLAYGINVKWTNRDVVPRDVQLDLMRGARSPYRLFQGKTVHITETIVPRSAK